MIVGSQIDAFVHDSNSISVEEKSQMQHLSVSLIFINQAATVSDSTTEW